MPLFSAWLTTMSVRQTPSLPVSVGEPAEGSLSITTDASAKGISTKPRVASAPRNVGPSAFVRKVVLRGLRLPGRSCRPTARSEVLCAVVACFKRKAVIQLQRASPPARVLCSPLDGHVDNGSQPKPHQPQGRKPNTTPYSGSFGSGVDEERS